MGITGREVEKILLDGTPRIVVGGSGGNSLTVMPYMMMPEDHKIAADALYAVLSKPPRVEAPKPPAGEPVNLAGKWQVHVEYSLGSAEHTLTIDQAGEKISGSHASEMFTGQLRGSVQAAQVQFHSSHRIQGTAIGYDFTGTADSGGMQGTVAMGEYGQAHWTARRAV